MSVLFKPDRYGVIVIHKFTSTSGRWIGFLGTHYDGTHQCYDVGFFQTTTGACQRLHFKDNKTGAMIEYDDKKEKLTRKRASTDEEREKYTILGPDGSRTS